MRRGRNGRVRFAGSLWLALAAAATLPATVLVLGPLAGRNTAIAVHWVVVATAYAGWIAPTLRRSLAAMGFVLVAGVALIAAVGPGLAAPGPATVIGVAALAGLARSVILYRIALVRGLVVEFALGGSAALLAGLFSGSSILAAMAAIWGFWLIQSVHALLPGLRFRGSTDGSVDAFEQAMSRLEGLLEDA
jgi:hypothetical protein